MFMPPPSRTAVAAAVQTTNTLNKFKLLQFFIFVMREKKNDFVASVRRGKKEQHKSLRVQRSCRRLVFGGSTTVATELGTLHVHCRAGKRKSHVRFVCFIFGQSGAEKSASMFQSFELLDSGAPTFLARAIPD
jgi:hypothetical protein